MTNSKGSKVVIDGRTKDEIIRDLRREIGKLNNDVVDMRAAHQNQWDRICVNLPDEMRARARAVWDAALHAHETATEGMPGPVAVVASALLDAEKVGPRRLKGSGVDPVAFIAERIESIAAANGKDAMELFQRIASRMNADREDAEPKVLPELPPEDEDELKELRGDDEEEPSP